MAGLARWAWSLVGFALLGLVVLVVILALRPVTWQLNLLARTEVLHLTLTNPQSWQLRDAVVCVQGNPPGAAQMPKAAEFSLLPRRDPACAGRQWFRLDTSGLDGQGVLNLFARVDAPITVQLDTSRSGALHLALRSTVPGQSLGEVVLQGGGGQVASLGSELNISWPGMTQEQAVSEDGAVVVLPFSGAVTVGRDVSGSTQHMLMSGEISVFSASESHLGGRTVAEHSVLMLGDRVDIKAPERPGDITPKGFLRFNRHSGAPHEGSTMEVVAHALAEQVVIHRYGGGDHKFEAGWWVRLKHQSSLVILLLVFTGALSMLNSLVGIVPGCRQFFRWCGAVSRREDCKPQGNDPEPRN